MWLACQVTEKDPSRATRVCTVGAQLQPVWWPLRSIWRVLPAALGSTLPLNRIWLFRKPAPVVVMVMPPALAVTRPVAGWPELPDELLELEVVPCIPPPPEAAR